MQEETVDTKDTAADAPVSRASAGRTGDEAVAAFLQRPLGELLDELADEQPVPGAGSAAALATAMGAGLLAMAARAARESWPEAGAVAAQADALRNRVVPLALADAEAYADVLRLLAEPVAQEQDRRDVVLGAALSRAATLPLRIAECACDVAELAAFVVERGDPRFAPDVASAALLAESAARVGAHLVRVNLATQAGDTRVEEATALEDATAEAARRALREP